MEGGEAVSKGYEFLFGARLDPKDIKEIESNVAALKQKVEEEVFNIKINLTGQEGAGDVSNALDKTLKSSVAEADKLALSLKNVGQSKNYIHSQTESIKTVNDQILVSTSRQFELGKWSEAHNQLRINSASQLKQAYDRIAENMSRQFSIEKALIPLTDEKNSAQKTVLTTQLESLKVLEKEDRQKANALKQQQNITVLLKDEIKLNEQRASQEQKIAIAKAKQHDTTQVQKLNFHYKEAMKYLTKIDSINRQIASSDASKNYHTSQQLRTKRSVLQSDLVSHQMAILELENTKQTALGEAQILKLKERQREIQQNIALYQNQALDSLRSTKGAFSGFLNELKVAVLRSIQWSMAMGTLYGSIRQIKAGAEFLIEIDTALTEIAMVTQQTRQEVDYLAESYLNLAKNLKVSTSEIMQSSVSLFRQGLNAGQVNERLVTISQTARVTGESIERVTDFVTVGVNALGVEAERFNDVLIKTASIAGTTYGELGAAISKNASSFKNANVELEKITSYMAAIIERTRESAESVGTFGKTLVARFQRINQETGELNGELNLVQKAIESVNVKFLDAQGQIRPVSDILDDLNDKWSTLDGNTQKYIATQAAGLRQGNRFLALMDGYDRSLEIYDETMDAAGTTQEQYNKYLESTQALIDELKVTWENLYMSVINSDWIKVFYRGLINLVDSIRIVITEGKALLLVIGAYAVWKKAQGLILSYNAALGVLKAAQMSVTATNLISQLDTQAEAFGKSSISLKNLITRFSNFNPIVAAATAAIGLLVLGFIDAKKKAEEFGRAQEELQQIIKEGTLEQQRETLKSLEELQAQYRKLNEEIDNLDWSTDSDVLQPLAELQIQLQDVEGEMRKYGVTVDDIDDKIKDMTTSLVSQETALENEKRRVVQLSELYEEHIETIKHYTDTQLTSHEITIKTQIEEMKAIIATTKAWRNYASERERIDTILGVVVPTATIKKIKIGEWEKEIENLETQLEAIDAVWSTRDWSARSGEVDGDGDAPTDDQIWKDHVDEVIKQLDREKKNRQEIWRLIESEYDDRISDYQTELDLLKERNKELSEEEERRKRLKDIADAQANLQNVLKERRFQVRQGGQWVSVADPREVKKAQDDVERLTKDFNSWETDNARRKEEEILSNKIKAIQIEKEEEKAKYEEIERIAEDVIYNIRDIEAETLNQRMDMLTSYVDFYNTEMSRMITAANWETPNVKYESPSKSTHYEGGIKYDRIGSDIYKDDNLIPKENYKYIPTEIGGTRGIVEEPKIVAKYVEGGIEYTIDTEGKIRKDEKIIDAASHKFIPSVIGGTREGQRSYSDVSNFNIENLTVVADNADDFAAALELAAKTRV